MPSEFALTIRQQRVLDAFREYPGATYAEIARKTRVSVTTTAYDIRILTARGMLDLDDGAESIAANQTAIVITHLSLLERGSVDSSL